MMLVRRIVGSSAALLAALAVAGPASAQVQYLMSGQWYQNRGPIVDIPIHGGAVAYPNCMTIMQLTMLTGVPNAPAGCIGNPGLPNVPLLGGIPNTPMAAVTATGMSPATLIVPPGVFQDAPAPTALGLMIIAPTLVQLGSSGQFFGPAAARALTQMRGMTTPLGGGITVATPVPPAMGTRVLRASDWTDQTGRVAAAFTWCPGTPGTPVTAGGMVVMTPVVPPAPPVAPACATPASGAWPGLVSYTPGPSAFGGTMTMLLSSLFVVSVVGPGGVLVHQPVSGNFVTGGGQHPGRGYSTTDTDYLMGGPVLAVFMTGPPCLMAFPFPQSPPGCGVITTSMTTVGMGAPDRNRNWGFPWTTGMVTALNTGTIFGMMQTTTLVGTGTDMRTPLGSGMITLVSGGFSHRFGAVTMIPQDFTPLDVVVMNLNPFKTPAFSPAGMVAGVVLMLLAVGFAARRRL